MSEGIQSRLSEVEDASEADDEAVDLAEGGEAEDFGCIVPNSWSTICIIILDAETYETVV